MPHIQHFFPASRCAERGLASPPQLGSSVDPFPKSPNACGRPSTWREARKITAMFSVGRWGHYVRFFNAPPAQLHVCSRYWNYSNDFHPCEAGRPVCAYGKDEPWRATSSAESGNLPGRPITLPAQMFTQGGVSRCAPRANSCSLSDMGRRHATAICAFWSSDCLDARLCPNP